MNRKLILTDDGSHTIFVPELNEQYHSNYGAIQESQHVFINSGLAKCLKKNITIFEVGFGTGLNALLALIYAEKNNIKINYISIEKYPLIEIEYNNLNYSTLLKQNTEKYFNALHQCLWNENITITNNFNIHKVKNDLRNIALSPFPLFDLIFFDAFAPNKQPDLWEHAIYKKIFDHANQGAIFVTYCAKGIVRRDLQEVGFNVERIPGPPGKKEMLRAFK